MAFTSFEFAVFLPIVFFLYWLVFNKNYKRQNTLLVIASYVFYGLCDWRFLFLLALTSFCTWGSGLLIQRFREKVKLSKAVSTANIVINLAILGVFKYYDFFAASFANLFLGGKSDGILLHLVLPVGISFYTFQALSYSIDVYKGNLAPTKDIIALFAYVGFFPQLLAGPIGKASYLFPQYLERRRFDYKDGADGVKQIIWGLFKKIVIADTCAEYVNMVWADYPSYSGSTLLLGAILYSVQIYSDFSGYSDMAIGVSRLFGIKLKRNFNLPYFSRSVAEFWRRWHISLTSWFREYLYFPLGGSRCSKARTILNTSIVFLVSGLWHGANWTYITWGGLYALMYIPAILSGTNKKYKDTVAENHFFPNVKELFQMLVTFFLVTMCWVFFRADSISQAFGYIGGMLSSSIVSVPWIKERLFFIPLAIAICFTFLFEWVHRREDHPVLGSKHVWAKRMAYLVCVVSIYICLILRDQGNPEFIYSQF